MQNKIINLSLSYHNKRNISTHLVPHFAIFFDCIKQICECFKSSALIITMDVEYIVWTLFCSESTSPPSSRRVSEWSAKEKGGVVNQAQGDSQNMITPFSFFKNKTCVYKYSGFWNFQVYI